MQTAAEYRVLAEAAYRAAGELIPKALADRTWTAATEQTADPSALTPAVILDLDETVLDNSRFQGEQVHRREPFTVPLWSSWIDQKKAGLVPGAKEFLQDVRDRKIAVFFVTNRTLDQESATLANLSSLGVQATAEEILANRENGWTSDKTARREHLAKSYRILFLIGDDLGDFLPAQLTPEKRVEAAEKHSDWWGKRWFLLPNPMYGSWDRALYDFQNLPDEEVLRRKLELVKGFPKAVTIDHLVLGVSDLNAGIEEFRSRTGIEPVFGGNHPNGGTRNALASLGDGTYIEIIAPNPDVELSPMFASLKTLATLTPILWAVGVEDAEATKALLDSKGYPATPVSKGSRVKPDGSVLKWQTVAVPSTSSYLPFFIQWDKDSVHPSKASPAGCSLASLNIMDPAPEPIQKLLAAFQLTPDVKLATTASLAFVLKCPKGEVRFDSPQGS